MGFKNFLSRFGKKIGIIGRKKLSPTEVHQYWENPDDGSNLPQQYVGDGQNVHKSLDGDVLSHRKRSEMLVSLITEYGDSESKIMEIGCNVGRNLNYLFNANYIHLEAIEISSKAVQMLEVTFPEMASSTKIHNLALENIVREFEDDQFDIVFTMAVLEHLHEDNEWVFSHISRMTKGYLITIEDEKTDSKRHFPRSYKRIFEQFGMVEVKSFKCVRETHGLGSVFRTRVFEKFRN